MSAPHLNNVRASVQALIERQVAIANTHAQAAADAAAARAAAPPGQPPTPPTAPERPADAR